MAAVPQEMDPIVAAFVRRDSLPAMSRTTGLDDSVEPGERERRGNHREQRREPGEERRDFGFLALEDQLRVERLDARPDLRQDRPSMPTSSRARG